MGTNKNNHSNNLLGIKPIWSNQKPMIIRSFANKKIEISIDDLHVFIEDIDIFFLEMSKFVGGETFAVHRRDEHEKDDVMNKKGFQVYNNQQGEYIIHEWMLKDGEQRNDFLIYAARSRIDSLENLVQAFSRQRGYEFIEGREAASEAWRYYTSFMRLPFFALLSRQKPQER